MDPTPQELDSSTLLSGGNAPFVDDLYETYLRDPAAVSAQWRAYFDALPTPGAEAAGHSVPAAAAAPAARAKSRARSRAWYRP